MKNLKASDIRQMYIDFFVEKEHMVEPFCAISTN